MVRRRTFGLPLVAVATAAIVTTSSPIAAVVDNPDVMLGTLVAGSIVAFLLVNWWEEVGWTGFALERLQPKLGPIGASVVTTGSRRCCTCLWSSWPAA